MRTEEIRKACEEIYPEAVKIRRKLHQNPEIGMECKMTQEYLCTLLDEAKIPYEKLPKSGVIAHVYGKKEGGKCVMLRADHDALEIYEKTGLSYQSLTEGRMHACGHDLHTAMLYGAGVILKEHADEFGGEVRLLFQPAEEISEGALYFVENGAINHVDGGMGIHVDPLLPCGVVSVRNGADWAGVDRFQIRIKGVGAHGATPHKGKDPLVCACALVGELQTVVSRRVNPLEPLVVTVGQIHAGSAYNIIPEEAYLEGTCRSFNTEVQKGLPQMFEEIAKNLAASYGCEAKVDFVNSAGALINDDAMVEQLRQSAKKILKNPEELVSRDPEMIGEDFAEFAQRIPCVFAHLGTDGGAPLHSPYVNFKEEAMINGMALEVQFALDYLEAEK